VRHLSSRIVRRNRRWSVLVAVGLLVSLLAVRAQADDPLDPYLGDPGRTYPNLVPNVKDVQIQTYRLIENDVEIFFENGLFLWFDTRAQNLGEVPVQLTVDKVDTPESSTVSQCISWRLSDAHLCRETEVVGGYAWHDAHNHFHYEDFARYQLRTLAADGRPDYSDSGLVGVSDKVSFCFVDSEKVDPTDTTTRPTPLYESCLPAVQGITPGWTDIYTSDMAGQNFDIAGLPNGRYAVIVDMDYENTLYETNDDDNYIEVTIEISDGDPTEYPAGRKAEILDRRWPAPNDRGTPTTTSSTTTTTKKDKKPKLIRG
jgi:hypothetical protein